MKIVSFNTNGIRARPHQLRKLVELHDPDVIGIQETKVQDADFPMNTVNELGYHAVFHGQKSHYGVATLTRVPPLQTGLGFPEDPDDAQRRLITTTVPLPDNTRITVINGYFPQGESRDHPVKFPAKRKFYADLLDYIEQNFEPAQPLILLGDMNVAPADLDVGIGEENAKRWLRTGKCSFLPEEREWLQRLLDWGLVDTYRAVYPKADDRMSWFDYRSRGFEREPKRGLRIDLILATPMLAERCTGAGICYDIRGMEKPSDHCPIWTEFEPI